MLDPLIMYRTVLTYVMVVLCCAKCNVLAKRNNASIWFDNYETTKDYKNVATEAGLVRGKLAEDGDYLAFLGIPYAAPPTNRNRFKAPLPPVSWNGVYEANRKVKCPQNGEGDEDCLVLNVFTPTKIVNGPLPVLVYIHGGSFLLGSAQTKGVEPLIKQNIIVVTINYRLGALGFLCLGIEEAPGNAGLKDQVAALRWVKKNIANFGGDPNKVTLYGMSAGGASTEFHVLSKMSKNLFQRAIIESATANSVWTMALDPIATASEFSKVLNFTNKKKNVYKLLDFYLQIPANTLSSVNYQYYNNLTDGTFGFVPCIERKIYGTQTFLSDSPQNILSKERYNKVPMMFAYASLEGLFLRSSEYYENSYKDRMQTNFLDFLPADLVFDTDEIKDEIAKNIRHFYFGNKTIDENDIINYLNYFGDYLVMRGLLNSVEAHSKDGNPVYLIEFNYKGNLGSHEKYYEHIKVAGHGDMIKYAILNKNITNDRDKTTVARVARIIGNYVKFGNPIPERTQLLSIFWPTVQPSSIVYLQLSDSLQVLEEPQWGRKVFWDQLYSRFRREITPADPGFL